MQAHPWQTPQCCGKMADGSGELPARTLLLLPFAELETCSPNTSEYLELLLFPILVRRDGASSSSFIEKEKENS